MIFSFSQTWMNKKLKILIYGEVTSGTSSLLYSYLELNNTSDDFYFDYHESKIIKRNNRTIEIDYVCFFFYFFQHF